MKPSSSTIKRASRALALVLALMLLLTMTAPPALAADGGTASSLHYAVNSDGTIRITSYTGDASELDIPAEIDGKSVTHIEDRAFKGCTSLKSVTIPEGVIRIWNSAFENCTSLKSVTIPKSVTDIDKNAFGYYEDEKTGDYIKVNGFTITGYKNSAAYAYARDNGFEFVSLGEVSPFVYEEHYDGTIETVHYYGDATQLDIPTEMDGKKVTEIGPFTFYDGTRLTSVTIPESVTGIANHAFENCTNLTSVTISNGVISISSTAFENCTNLKSVNIPESVKTIEYDAFNNCPNLKAVTIPASVTSIGNRAFGYYADEEGWNDIKVDGFTITGYKNSAAYAYARNNGFEFKSLGEVNPFVYKESYYDETIEITHYYGDATELDIPAELDGKSVSAISGDDAWSGAFGDCRSLKKVTIPEGVTTIIGNAFNGCTNLKSVTIPNSVTSIGGGAFRGCTSLESVTIPEGVTAIGWDTFSMCKSLTSINIPKSVTEIGTRAFYGCASLTSVTISDGVVYINASAFYNCPNLKAVTIPTSVTSIGDNAFGYYEDEKTWDDIKIDGFTITGYKNSAAYAYARDNGFKFTSLGEVSPFAYNELENGTLEIVAYYGDDKYTMTTLNIPAGFGGKSVTKISAGVFEDCTNLKSVTIPASVTSIGDNAFGYYEDEETRNDVKIDGFKITGYKNSAAYAYARDNGFKFTSLGEVSPFAYNELENGTLEIVAYYGDDKDTMTELVIPAEINNKKVSSIVSPDTVNGDGVFEKCTNLEKVTIPEGITSIGSSAFEDCQNLKSVTIPKSVALIGTYAFGYYKKAMGMTYSTSKVDGFKITGYKNSVAFAYARDNEFEFTSIGEVSPFVYEVLENGAIKISDYYGDAAELDIPAELDGKIVAEIGYSAFYGRKNLKTVTIPKSVTSIGKRAFGYYMTTEMPTTKNVTSINERYYESTSKVALIIKKVEGFTIKGYSGTEAERYAKDNGFNFVALEEKKSGDIDGSGAVDAKDRMTITRYIAKWKGYESIDKTAADVNADGEVDAADRMIITRHIAKWKGYETLPYTS